MHKQSESAHQPFEDPVERSQVVATRISVDNRRVSYAACQFIIRSQFSGLFLLQSQEHPLPLGIRTLLYIQAKLQEYFKKAKNPMAAQPQPSVVVNKEAANRIITSSIK